VSEFFAKLRLWTRVIVLGALAIYLILFVSFNWGTRINGDLHFVFTKFNQPRILFVLLVTAVISVFGWWLFRTLYKTIRQLREVSLKTKTAQLERDMAEMKAKAGMLQTKESASSAGTTPPPPV
jgi:hypothetical protein